MYGRLREVGLLQVCRRARTRRLVRCESKSYCCHTRTVLCRLESKRSSHQLLGSAVAAPGQWQISPHTGIAQRLESGRISRGDDLVLDEDRSMIRGLCRAVLLNCQQGEGSKNLEPEGELFHLTD